MVLEFKFYYSSSNSLLEGLLLYYARGLKASLKRQEAYIYLGLEGSLTKLEDFCEKLNQLSHSLFLQSFEVNASQNADLGEENTPLLTQKYSNLSYKNANAYLKDESLEDNEFGCFVDAQLFLENDFTPINKENFTTLLKLATQKLTQGKAIKYKDENALYEISLFKGGDFHLLMPTVIKNLNKLFACNDETLKLLASFEKPVMELKFNAIFKANHPSIPSHARVFLASNLFLFALGLALSNESFLAFNRLEKYQDVFEVAKPLNKLVVLKGSQYLNPSLRGLIDSKEDKMMAKFSYLYSSHGVNSLLFSLNFKEDDLCLLKADKSCIDFTKIKDLNSANALKTALKSAENGEKLLANYEAKHHINDFFINPKANLYSLLKLAGAVLGFDGEHGRKLIENAKACKLPKGVLIDFKLKDGVFDALGFIRSVMSFKLAGCDDKLLCLSILHSLAYFIRDFYDEKKSKYSLDALIITGDLFVLNPLLSQVIKQNKDLKFDELPLRL